VCEREGEAKKISKKKLSIEFENKRKKKVIVIVKVIVER
jgi:hypothetical protein